VKPVVVLIGRPNVGKSTLFNRLTRSRAALVADVPGLTRDRQYGDGQIGDRPYFVVDTGGVMESLAGSNPREELRGSVSAQTRQALSEADSAILVVDGRDGLQPGDRQLAQELRRLGKPLWLAVNKSEALDGDVAVAEFHALGLGEPFPISAAHGEGVEELMQPVLADLPVVEIDTAPREAPRIAVIGRPNVGKSSLVNALIGEERVVVCDEAGTTRDSIHIPLERDGRRYVLIDTAGVRRRSKVEEAQEKFSVIKTLQSVADADVVVLLVDAVDGVTEQDAGLAGYALEQGRAMVVAINKWDLLDRGQRQWIEQQVTRKLMFLDYARTYYISALYKTGIGALFPAVDRAYLSAWRELQTSKLNRVIEKAVQATPPPVRHGRRIRVKYAHQGGKNPLRIIVHGNQVEALRDSYKRFLGNAVRNAYKLEGAPVLVECRDVANPFAGRRPKSGAGGKTKARRKVRRERKN
jgi:GTP-binding protein